MAFFRATFDLIKGKFSRSSRPDTNHKVKSHGTHAPATQYPALVGGVSSGERPTDTRTKWLDQLDFPRKRRATDVLDHDDRKKTRHTSEAIDSGYGDVFGNKGDNNGLQTEHDTLNPKQRSDRHMMPPPAVPINLKGQKRSHHRVSLDSLDNTSQAQSYVSRRSEVVDEYDMEAARRKAAATELPESSGIWETAEKELFFHLSYRGFEPLVSRNWMKDFQTLPLSLFDNAPDAEPLIQVHSSSEFRAIKALRELIDTGKTIRDRAVSSNQELRSEPVIEKAINKYLRWAFKDMRIPIKQCIPVHAIMAMKPGRTTQDTIRNLTVKMHNLSARHRRACDVHPSIERDQSNSSQGSDSETRLVDERTPSEQNLPVIYGMMICRTLLAVFTLNSHTPPPRFVRHAQGLITETQDTALNPGDTGEHEDGDEESGLRFIASFDFSDSASDVWNAFVIAIVAMMVRKTMVEIYDIPTTFETQEYEESLLESSLLEVEDSDDPDL